MAENETKKEKATINMNFWFIIFLVYLIFSLAFCFSLNQEKSRLETELAAANETISTIQKNSQSSINDTIAIIDNLSDMLAQAKQELLNPNGSTTNNVEVSTGVYTGSSDTTSVTLTLSENNIATLTVVNGSGDTTLNGTYSIAENLVTFTSEDGASTTSFTALENGALTTVLDNIEITLNK